MVSVQFCCMADISASRCAIICSISVVWRYEDQDPMQRPIRSLLTHSSISNVCKSWSPVITSWLGESPIPTSNTVTSLSKFCLAFLQLRDERYLHAWTEIWDCSDNDYFSIYLISTPPLTPVSWDIPVALWMHFHLRHGYLNPESQFLIITERFKIMSLITAVTVLSLYLWQNLSRGCMPQKQWTYVIPTYCWQEAKRMTIGLS
jgi:hypothetical protein